jgi:hypothetical protein
MKLVYILLSVLLFTAACKKEVGLDTPDFNVKSATATFRAGQEGKIYFEGTAGIISFYSGETGFEYDKRIGSGNGVDKAKPVKGISDVKQESFSYTYLTKGTYKAYFAARNANIYDGKEIVRVVDVTVTD